MRQEFNTNITNLTVENIMLIRVLLEIEDSAGQGRISFHLPLPPPPAR